MTNRKKFSATKQEQDALYKVLQGENPAEKLQSDFRGRNILTPPKDLEPGETWESPDGSTWEQKDKYKVRTTGTNIGARVPMFCPKCDSVMKGQRDTKSFWLHKHCHDCQIEYETSLKLKGKYEEYMLKREIANLKSYLRDQKDQFEDFKESHTQETETLINGDGRTMKWFNGIEIENVEEEFEEFVEEVESQIQTKKDRLREIEDDHE